MRIRILAVLALATTLCLAPCHATAVTDVRAVAASKPACTIVGTRGDDVLRGTSRDDVICGRGGSDRLVGRGGSDILQGGRGDDAVVGGPGNDTLSGGPGSDVLDGHDHWRNTDRLACGAGRDQATADALDRVGADCERPEQGAAPTGIELAPTVVEENAPAGTVVGQLTATDPDGGDTHTFTLDPGEGSADNDAFTIEGTSLTTRALLDHEATPTLNVRIRVTDAAGHQFAAALTIDVADVDDPTIARDDVATVAEDSAATTVEVLANDTDPDGPEDGLAVASVTQPANGRAAVAGGGLAVTYQPNPNFCSADTFTYTLADGATATVSVIVACVDDAPRAVDDTATVLEDAAATTVPVLANDADPDGGSRTITSVTQPGHGTVVITGGGAGLTYAPQPDACNDGTPTDDFTYTLAPGGSTAQVRVTVACDQESPVATDDTRTTAEDTPLTLPAAGAGSPVSNDTDADGDALTVTAVSGATGGTVGLTAGIITFTPSADLCGANAGGFDYTVSDGNGGTDTGHVTVTLTCVPDAPTAADDTATVAEDAGATALAVLANDDDADGDAITITSVTQPGHGTVVITGGGTGLTYAPQPDSCNDGTPTDDFTYTVNGGSTADVEVTVTCAPDAPVATDDTRTTDEDAALIFPATGLVSNDTDADADTLTVTAVSGATGGTVGLTAGIITFTPSADLCGVGAGGFDYTVSDGDGGTDTGHVTVTLTCVPDAPTAADDTATVAEDAGATALAVLANDDDADGDAITITSVTQPGHGTVVITGGGTGLTYAPDPDACTPAGTDDFTYTVNGGSTADVEVTVTCAPDAPVLTTNSGATAYTEDNAATVIDSGLTVDDADTDAEITEATVTITAGFASGEDLLALSGSHSGIAANQVGATLTLSGTASLAAYQAALRDVTYENTSQAPSDADRTVTFEVTDDTGRSDDDTKTVTVTPVDDAPLVHGPGPQVLLEDGTLVFSAANGTAFTFTDEDLAPGEEITVSLELQNRGTWELAGDIRVDPNTDNYFTGTPAELAATFEGLAFTPLLNDNGGDYSRFSITPYQNGVRLDGRGATSIVAVTAVNDAPVVSAPTTAVAVGGSLEFSSSNGNEITIMDVDAGGNPMTLDLTATLGVVRLASTDGLVVTGDGTAHVRATGTAAALNHALSWLVYDHHSFNPGTLTVLVNDNGWTGVGVVARTGEAAIDITYSD